MKSYLGVAADLQNGRAKPWWPSPRERSQGGAAMRRHEEACSLDLTGGHLSQNEGRVSPLRTKPSLLVSRSSRPTTKAVRWLGGMVRPALMLGKWFVSLTDEVPRDSSFGSITWIYKAQPKGFSHAPVAGTATPWPRLQGCLQRQSTSPPRGHGKAKPQSEFSTSVGPWDKLASAKKPSLTPNPLLRPGAHQEEDGSVLSARLPVLGASSVPSREPYLPRVRAGSPGAGNLLAGPVWGIDPIATTGRGWRRPPPYPLIEGEGWECSERCGTGTSGRPAVIGVSLLAWPFAQTPPHPGPPLRGVH